MSRIDIDSALAGRVDKSGEAHESNDLINKCMYFDEGSDSETVLPGNLIGLGYWRKVLREMTFRDLEEGTEKTEKWDQSISSGGSSRSRSPEGR